MSNEHSAHQNASSEYSPLLSPPDQVTERTSNPPISSRGLASLQKTTDGNADEIDKELKKRVFWALPALAIGIFLAAADQTIVVSSYGKIGSEMNALNNTSWIATAYV